MRSPIGVGTGSVPDERPLERQSSRISGSTARAFGPFMNLPPRSAYPSSRLVGFLFITVLIGIKGQLGKTGQVKCEVAEFSQEFGERVVRRPDAYLGCRRCRPRCVGASSGAETPTSN